MRTRPALFVTAALLAVGCGATVNSSVVPGTNLSQFKTFSFYRPSSGGPASVAQALYRETDASRTARKALREQRRMQGPARPATKPDKRARRLIRALGDIDAF